MRYLMWLSLVCGGCGAFNQSCNLMFSPSGLEISVASSAFQPGEWLVEVEGDLLATCAVTLPTPEFDVSCDDSRLALSLSEGGDAIVGITLFDASPEELVVTFVRDGLEIDRFELEPTYSEREPNGPGCGVSRNGNESISLE